jgi:hypothetical protein
VQEQRRRLGAAPVQVVQVQAIGPQEPAVRQGGPPLVPPRAGRRRW